MSHHPGKPIRISATKAVAAGWTAPRNYRRHPLHLAICAALYGS